MKEDINYGVSLKILDLLVKSRNGMNRRQIYGSIDYFGSLENLAVILSAMQQRNMIQADGYIECDHCKHAARCYRITEKGRLHLQHKLMIA